MQDKIQAIIERNDKFQKFKIQRGSDIMPYADMKSQLVHNDLPFLLEAIDNLQAENDEIDSDYEQALEDIHNLNVTVENLNNTVNDMQHTINELSAFFKMSEENLQRTQKEIAILRHDKEPVKWINCEDEMPEVDYSQPPYARYINVIAGNDNGTIGELRYVSDGYAKTEKGRLPKWKYPDGNRVYTGKVTCWIPLHKAPTLSMHKVVV